MAMMYDKYTKAEQITNGLIYLMRVCGRENVMVDAQHDVLMAGMDLLRADPPQVAEEEITRQMEAFGWHSDTEGSEEPFSWAIFT